MYPSAGTFVLIRPAQTFYERIKVRKTAFDFLNDVAVTGSHLQMFIDYIGPMRGWGRGLRKAIGNWYTQRPLKDAVYQTVKYRQRYNWTHRDLLRKAHPYVTDSQMNILFEWITKGTLPSWQDHPALHLILAYEDAKTAGPNDLARIIELRKLTWEMVPSEMLDKPEVWRALTQDMPMTALLRNLATLTRVGVIAPMDSAEVCERLRGIGNPTVEDYARIHPISILSALLTYRAGKGVRGKNTWIPVPQVIDALDAAFGRSFSQAPQTNKRLYLGIDVSGSMASGEVAGVPGLSPRMAAAAMAMAIARKRAKLLHGRVRGLFRVQFNTCLYEPASTRHVAPEHHGIGQHLRRHAEDQGLALRPDRLRLAHAGRYEAKDERGLLHHSYGF